MTKGSIAVLLSAFTSCVLAVSCGSSDGGSSPGAAGIGGGSGGNPGSAGAGGGAAGSADLGGGADVAGAAGVPSDDGAAGTTMGAGGEGEGGSAGADGGASGAGGPPPDLSPLSPADVPDLAFWMDGNARSYSDLDENYPTPPDSGRVRSIPEAEPLTGQWQAPTGAERPIRELGALRLRPVESPTGYYLKDTAGTIQTDDSTIALSLVPLNSNSAQGALQARIGLSNQNLGIFFVGDSVGIYYNHTQVSLRKKFSRGVHATMVVRFTQTRIDVGYDINGLRTSESVKLTTPIMHETASNFLLGYDSNLNSSLYGFVSQVVGVNRAVSDTEATRMLSWIAAQPIPAPFPVTQPLVAIVGDSIGNGDQVSGTQSWAFTMLGNLAETYPDVQLLNNSLNGGGIPTVKNSPYSDGVLPWFSTKRAKNILVVAAGTNDIAGGSPVQDILDRYYGLLDSARTTGWKTVACTVLPRSNASLPFGLQVFETARVAFNADLRTHFAAHADALADVAAIPGMGAFGDSDNLTYYSADKIHPIAAGHALLEPVYRAAVSTLLKPDSQSPKP